MNTSSRDVAIGPHALDGEPSRFQRRSDPLRGLVVGLDEPDVGTLPEHLHARDIGQRPEHVSRAAVIVRDHLEQHA